MRRRISECVRVLLRGGLPLAVLATFAFSTTAQEEGSRREVRPVPGASTAAKEDPRITRTKERYRFATWPRATERRDGVALAAFTFPGFEAEPIDFAPGGPLVLRYRGEDGAPWFLVEIAIEDTAKGAREVLLGHLAHVSAMKEMPTTASAGITAGEIGFVGYSRDERISWIAFVRGNVAVRICCLDPDATPHPDVRSLAERADRLVRAQPRLAPASKLTPPTITTFSLPRAVCVEGEGVALETDAKDVVAWYWEIAGGATGFVERDAQGRWVLHTTGPGPLELTGHALGRNGVAAARKVTLEVLDD